MNQLLCYQYYLNHASSRETVSIWCVDQDHLGFVINKSCWWIRETMMWWKDWDEFWWYLWYHSSLHLSWIPSAVCCLHHRKCARADSSDTCSYCMVKWQQNAHQKLLFLWSSSGIHSIAHGLIFFPCSVISLTRSDHDYWYVAEMKLEYKEYLAQMLKLAGDLHQALAYFVQYFCPGDIESCHLEAARRVKLWSLNANFFFKEPHHFTKFN